METTSISKYKCPECGSNVLIRTLANVAAEYECLKCNRIGLFLNIDDLNEYLKQNQRRVK